MSSEARTARDEVARRALLAGVSGGAAALTAGALAALVYAVGYGLETGGTFDAPGGNRDFTGLVSGMAAVFCGGVCFPALGLLLVRRSRVRHPGEVVLPGIVFTFITLFAGFEFLGLPESKAAFAVAGPVAAAFCFAAVALGFDDRAPGRLRMAAALCLFGPMLPLLNGLF